MAYNQILFLVILSLISSSIQDVTNNKVDSQDESPLADVAKEILKEKNLEHIGGMVNSFIQSGGAKQLMDGVLQNLGSNENSGHLLESLGSLLKSGGETGKDEEQGASRASRKSNGDINPMELFSVLGSLVGAMQGAGADGGQGNPAALLQGLGALLGGGTNNAGAGGVASLLEGLGSLLGENKGGKKGGINPEMIGNMINMYANSQGESKKEAKPSKSRPSKKAHSGKSRKKKDPNLKNGTNKGLDGILSLASTFLNRKGTGNGNNGLDMEFLFENFPLILKMAKPFGGPELKKYLDPVDDMIFVYNEIMNKKADNEYAKLTPRLIRIYRAYRKLVAPYIKSVKSENQDQSFDFGSIINMASTFLNQAGSNNVQGGSNFVDYLPMIMNTISAFTGQEAEEKANSHSGHSWALPPILERIHIYYDIFINSDMGKQWLSYIGDQRAFKVFQDQNGNFNYNRFEELIENHSFRRHWIQQITAKLVEFLKLISDENIQSQYIAMGVTFTNAFLKNSGFPKDALLDMNQPAKSINNFAKFAAKKYLDADVDTDEYVGPAVIYVQDLLKMARASITPGSQPKELTDKLTETINMEIIEPITRVNRAYRFARSQPKCDRYVFCIINQDQSPNESSTLPGLKKGLYKGSSLIAGWFLSSITGTSYWDLYAVVTEVNNCQTFYHESCNGFYHEEVKATTEYIHNEL